MEHYGLSPQITVQKRTGVVVDVESLTLNIGERGLRISYIVHNCCVIKVLVEVWSRETLKYALPKPEYAALVRKVCETIESEIWRYPAGLSPEKDEVSLSSEEILNVLNISCAISGSIFVTRH